MNSKRIFFAMIGLVGLLGTALVAAVVYGNIMLSHQSKKLLDLKLEDAVVEEQQSALLAANKEIDQYADLEKIAKTVVPQDKDQARTVREINKIAHDSGIQLKSIVFPTSNLGQTAAAANTADNGDKTSTTGTTPAAPPITQVKAVDGVPGVYALEVNISSDESKPIPYSQFLDFLSRLENNRRTAQVTKINITPVSSGLSFILTVDAYVKP